MNMRYEMRHDVPSMLAAGRVGVVMGVAPRRVLAVAAQRRSRAAGSHLAPPATHASEVETTFAALAARLLQPTTTWNDLTKPLWIASP